jgi:hypothetical protein
MNQANMNLSEIECAGQVMLDNIARDEKGMTSHSRMQLARLSVNQQTGVVSGSGPGVIRSTQFSNGANNLVGPLGQSPRTSSVNESGSKLFFLRVDFQAGLDGNLYTRELTFRDRVRAVYGPVDAWEQELDPLRPETLPPESITLSADKLRLNEDPLAARAAAARGGNDKRTVEAVQLRAEGDVRIAGQMRQQGDFTVQATAASYDRSKDMFILEGDPRTPAKLWRRNTAGVDLPQIECQRIQYVRSTGEVKGNLQYLEITPDDIQNARRPKTQSK